MSYQEADLLAGPEAVVSRKQWPEGCKLQGPEMFYSIRCDTLFMLWHSINCPVTADILRDLQAVVSKLSMVRPNAWTVVGRISALSFSWAMFCV